MKLIRHLKKKLGRACEDIVLQYTYPRIDAEVSKHRNHLLKAPFCVHPGTGEQSSLAHESILSSRTCLRKTLGCTFEGLLMKPGRVCVPVDPKRVDDFDPDTVPNVGELLVELNQLPAAQEGEKPRREGTSSCLVISPI